MSAVAMRQVVVTESDVRRIWGALRFVDAASARAIDTPLELQAAGVRWVRNRSSMYVLMGLDEPAARRAELADYEAAFDPVPALAALPVSGTVRDPSARYLPRRFDFELPRAALPAGPDAPRFVPVDVPLDPSPAAPLLSTWAVLRLSLRHAGQPVAQAAIRLQRPDGALLGRGASDTRGEALVVASGIAQVNVGDGALVVMHEVPAELIISFDPAADPGVLVNPDTLAQRADVRRHRLNLNLASGRTQTLAIDLP